MVKLVASCMAEFRQHAQEARHFLIVSSVQPELASERDSHDSSLEKFQRAHDQIERSIRDGEWKTLREFVTKLSYPDIFMTDSPGSTEIAIRELWQRYSGFGVTVASNVVWLAEPKIYYLMLWKD